MPGELPRITIVILAAGGSERLGSPKQLLLYQGTTLIRHLTKVALDSRADSVAVVLGGNKDKIEPELSRLHVQIIDNPDWSKGLSSSIRAAVRAIGDETAALLFLLSDQPLVTTPLLNSLVERFRESRDSIVACEYSGTVGVPAIFPRKFFPQLAALAGDKGAKTVLSGHPSAVVSVPFPEGNVDIDTLTDLKKLT